MATSTTRKAAKKSKARKPVSQRKLEANRRNAQLSTGPRTEEGKAASSRNAWKTGQHSAVAKQAFAQHGIASMARLWGKPCQTTCPMHPDNPAAESHCSLVLEGMTRAGGNCLDKTVYVQALSALHDAMERGELGGVHAMLAAEGGKVMQLLHELMSEITSTGLMTAVPFVTKDGEVVYDKDGKMLIADYKPNPMIPAYIKLLGDFGISLPEMLATPQSRERAKVGQQAADTFQTMMARIAQAAGRPSAPGIPPARPAIEHQPEE